MVNIIKEYRIQLTKADAESAKTEPAVHEVPEFTGGVNGEEPAVYEVPEYTGGVNGVEAAVHEVPEHTLGANVVEPAVSRSSRVHWWCECSRSSG